MRPQFLNLQASLNQEPINYQEILINFQKALDSFDYYYDFSDDHSVWLAGQKEYNLLERAARQYPALRKIYSFYVKEKEAK